MSKCTEIDNNEANQEMLFCETKLNQTRDHNILRGCQNDFNSFQILEALF